MYLKSSMVLAAMGLFVATAQAQTAKPTSDEKGGEDGSSGGTNAANNPTTPRLTLEYQDFLSPALNGLNNQVGNQGLFRALIPVRAFDVENIIHVVAPINTNATALSGSRTGLGDIQLYNFSIFKTANLTFGLGPLVAIPTVSSARFGPDSLQAGFAGSIVAPQKWGLLGALYTYQHTVSGPSSALTTIQPIFHYNFQQGYYFRSTGEWVFNTGSHITQIPIGAGLGKVWNLDGGYVLNTYIEPQYSVYRSGVGASAWEIYAGVNLQFPVGIP